MKEIPSTIFLQKMLEFAKKQKSIDATQTHSNTVKITQNKPYIGRQGAKTIIAITTNQGQ